MDFFVVNLPYAEPYALIIIYVKPPDSDEVGFLFSYK